MNDPAAAFKLLGDPTRFRILEFLADPVQSCCRRGDGVCACDLEAFLGLRQATVSHHMKQLVETGMVRAERRGRWVYYEVEPDALRELMSVLQRFVDAGEAARAAQAGA